MKTLNFSLLILFLFGYQTYAQSPDWSVVENNFQYTMSMVAFSNIDGIDLGNPNHKIAAFVGSECRGVANLTYVANQEGYFAYLTIFSNTNSETISFKVYHAIDDKVVDIDETISFEINKHMGNLFTPHSVSKPKLSSENNIISFSLDEVMTTINSSSHTIIADLNPGYDLSNLKASFELSNGAKAFISGEELLPNTEGLDFSTAKEITIVSQDKTVSQVWTVSVLSDSSTAQFYRKNAVCYAKGAIKVVFPTVNTAVLLKKDNQVLKTQQTIDGNTTFNDLDAGIYLVEVNGTEKEIEILLKK